MTQVTQKRTTHTRFCVKRGDPGRPLVLMTAKKPLLD